ncbi:MAG: discoidin domain-containing protein [Phycisphaerae bacterium]
MFRHCEIRLASAFMLALAAVLNAPAIAIQPASPTDAPSNFSEPFEDVSNWIVAPSEGVEATITPVDGASGKAMRLDYNFKSGGGFVAIRRPAPIALGPDFQFDVQIRAESGDQNLELKLLSGEDVWWMNRRAYEFPKDWTRLVYRRRHFSYAWGPSGPTAPLSKIDAIEFAIASSTGGKGTVYFDSLNYTPLPAPKPYAGTPIVSVTSLHPAGDDPTVWRDGKIEWRSDEADASPTVTLDFGQFRDIGGIKLTWEKDDYAADYTVELSTDGNTWTAARKIEGGNGGIDFVPLPDAGAAQLRVVATKAARGKSIWLKSIEVKPTEWSATPNDLFANIAKESPRGWYPRYFTGEQAYWTVLGVAGDRNEALIDTDGAIELDRRGARLEPFLRVGSRLFTWADVKSTVTLAGGDLPIPTVTWTAGPIELQITALADGEPGKSHLLFQYAVRNISPSKHTGRLYLAIRPFLVSPPWQALNTAAGVSRIHKIEPRENYGQIDNVWLCPWTFFSRHGITTFSRGDVIDFIAADAPMNGDALADDTDKLTSGMIYYDFALEPQAKQLVHIAAGWNGNGDMPDPPQGEFATAEAFQKAFARVADGWRKEVNRVKLSLPASAKRLENTYRTVQAHVLINSDGPAIQPGSRTYERSWIRDGALTSTSLLYTGHTERVKAFIDWLTPNIFPSGKVPCVVDHRGPDPVPEYDSQGQLIYLLWRYYQFTGDQDVLQKYLPQVEMSVKFIEELRAQRMTPEYRDGPPEQRVKFGLVPESISHEGYSAKPMHSYWDGFFVIRGLHDAAQIARVLNRPELQQKYTKLLDDYRKAQYDSMRLAMEIKKVDYIPGCAELGDFDATSTAIGIYPCGELARIPQPALDRTFEKYWEFFQSRRDGKLDWKDYTPYELRIISAMLKLGRPDRSHALIDFFFNDQRPHEWNQWGEVVWRDPKTPRFIGDMPHTWCGSEFLRGMRNLLVYENEDTRQLVVGAGIRPNWPGEDDGVRIGDFPTQYGTISYHCKLADKLLTYELSGTAKASGGILVCNPTGRPARLVSVSGKPGTLDDKGRVKIETLPATVVFTLAD